MEPTTTTTTTDSAKTMEPTASKTHLLSSEPGPQHGERLNELDRRPEPDDDEEIYEMKLGPRPFYEEPEIQRRIQESFEKRGEEVEAFEEEEEELDEEIKKKMEASLWYYIIYEEIGSLTQYTLFWHSLQAAAWKKNTLDDSVLDALHGGRFRAFRPVLMNKLLEALNKKTIEPEDVVRAMIENGVPILNQCLRRCWVAVVFLFRNNKTFLSVIKEWIHENSPYDLNIGEQDLAEELRGGNFRCFPEFMSTQDDFFLSLILCAMKDATLKGRWDGARELSHEQSKNLCDLFAIASLYYSICFESQGLSIHKSSLWSPQCIRYKGEGSKNARLHTHIKMARNADGELVLTEDGAPFECWMEGLLRKGDKLTRSLKRTIEKLQKKLQEQETIVQNLLADKKSNNDE